jgi:hypothetical protein
MSRKKRDSYDKAWDAIGRTICELGVHNTLIVLANLLTVLAEREPQRAARLQRLAAVLLVEGDLYCPHHADENACGKPH